MISLWPDVDRHRTDANPAFDPALSVELGRRALLALMSNEDRAELLMRTARSLVELSPVLNLHIRSNPKETQ